MKMKMNLLLTTSNEPEVNPQLSLVNILEFNKIKVLSVSKQNGKIDADKMALRAVRFMFYCISRHNYTIII